MASIETQATADLYDAWCPLPGQALAPFGKRQVLNLLLGREFMEGLPRPVYWRVLVMPRTAEEKSKGGIIVAKEAQTAQEYQTYVGRILAAGGEAFKSERFANEQRLPEVGDWVVYGRYAGQRLEYRGVRLIVVNDDEILAVAADPETLRIYV